MSYEDNDSGQDLDEGDPPEWIEMFALALLAIVVAMIVVLWAVS